MCHAAFVILGDFNQLDTLSPIAPSYMIHVFQERDVNAQCTAFYRTLHAAIDLHFPLRKAKIHSNDRDWITPKVKLLMKKRQKAFHKNEREKWKRLRNRVMREIEKAKREYYCIYTNPEAEK